MRVVEFECGCVGLRDFDTEETIIFRHCEYAPDDVMFYRAGKDDHDGKPSKDMTPAEESLWITRVSRLVDDGKQMRQVRKIMRRD